MQSPLQITFRGMDASPAVDASIREHVAALEEIYDRIIGCRVVFEIPHKNHQKGKHFHLHIEISVPGDTLIVNRDPAEHAAHEDAYVAIRDAFRAAKRELRDFASKNQKKVKHHEPATATGRVSQLFLRESYGFLKTADGREVYFHENSLRGKKNLFEVEIGDEVTFAEEPGDKGPQATFVALAE